MAASGKFAHASIDISCFMPACIVGCDFFVAGRSACACGLAWHLRKRLQPKGGKPYIRLRRCVISAPCPLTGQHWQVTVPAAGITIGRVSDNTLVLLQDGLVVESSGALGFRRHRCSGQV